MKFSLKLPDSGLNFSEIVSAHTSIDKRHTTKFVRPHAHEQCNTSNEQEF